MKLQLIPIVAVTLFAAGCAVQQSPVKSVDSNVSLEAQRQAQQSQSAVSAPALKRKIALGRISNETNYGKSLLRDANGDVLGKQVTDMLAKALTESGHFIVLERSDISSLQKEQALTGQKMDLVGTDVLMIGSLTEFGRKVTGVSGFWSASKKQVAQAKMDVRAVDARTGEVIFAASGTGQSSTEASSIMGMGSRAGYDGTLNDKAINQAVSEIVNAFVTRMSERPWRTFFLNADKNAVAIAGGKSQGLNPGTTLQVLTQGKKVKSPQTGFMIQLPGTPIATIQVVSNFGDTPQTEGSLVRITSGSLGGHKISELVIQEMK